MLTEKHLWLDEPYEVESIWYPSFSVKKGYQLKKNRRHHGKLTYSPSNGALLQLYHDDVSLNWFDNMIYGGGEDSSWYDKITCLGISQHSGTNKSTIFRVGSVFRGFHLPDPEGSNILKFEFSIKHLNQWLKKTGFKFNRNTKKNSFTIRYKGSPGRWLKLNDLFDFKISTSAWPPHEVKDYGKIETREYVVFQLRGRNDTPHKYSDFIRLLYPILDFFTLASLDCANPFNIGVTGDFGHIEGFDGIKIPASATVSLSPITMSNQWFEAKKPYFLFCEEDLEKPLQYYLRNWLKKYRLVSTPFSLYDSAVYSEKNTETKFLLLSQAVESYHRRFRNGYYLSKSEFQSQVLRPLYKAIPAQLDRSFKASLKSRLKYSNEHSLRKRIKDLISENKNILERYFKVPKDLENKIVDARNYLTHFNKANHEITLSTLVFYITILKKLFELSLLKEIGFEQNKISMLTKDCESFRWLEWNAPWTLRHHSD
ncbi:MAG: hypothetical protein MUP16_00270 [Sedimentisphaerales bacterium]|nr:hypothetical protein [Sedimentisphaerales bacterium]